MTLTIEPGLTYHVDGPNGKEKRVLLHEENVVLTATGCELLTRRAPPRSRSSSDAALRVRSPRDSGAVVLSGLDAILPFDFANHVATNITDVLGLVIETSLTQPREHLAGRDFVPEPVFESVSRTVSGLCSDGSQ